MGARGGGIVLSVMSPSPVRRRIEVDFKADYWAMKRLAAKARLVALVKKRDRLNDRIRGLEHYIDEVLSTAAQRRQAEFWAKLKKDMDRE
jgi:hypothetical protein